MDHIEYISQIKNKLLQTAQSMINGHINLIAGCRILTELRSQLDSADDRIFNCFQAVDSETDHIPIGDIREHYNQKFLEKADSELDDYLVKVQPAIIDACENLVKKYS